MQMGAGFKISFMLTFLKSIFTKAESPCGLDRDEVRRLEKAMREWVAEKRYREYSSSREEIAAQLNTTKEFLNAYLKHVLNSDFNTWRTSLRIKDAKKILLEQKDLPISLVGEMVGISDRSNFHNQFTKIAGCSPKQWRDSDGIGGRCPS